MKVRIKYDSIVKEHKTGTFYAWHGGDLVFDVVSKGNATLVTEGYEGEKSIETSWDNLIEVKDELEEDKS